MQVETKEKLVEVATTQEISPGMMKHVEVEGNEIAITNINGKYYAFDDRCGHMCTPLSMGAINGNVVTCPFHGAQFDCITGKKVKDAILRGAAPSMDGLPEDWRKLMERNYKHAYMIKTYDLKRYDVMVDGDQIKISL